MIETTEDRFFDGRVRLHQFAHGFRSGLDAVMLAAATPAKGCERILELGSGAGTASLCLASRVAGCNISGVEIDCDLVSLANDNASRNDMASRVRFLHADALNLPAELRMQFDHVLCNPPFHDAGGEASPNASRARALQDFGDFSRWLKTGLRRTTSKGTFTIIVRADRLKDSLDALPSEGVIVLPLWPKRETPAKRVIVQVTRGKRTPFALLPGLVLHDGDNRYTPEAEAILREGAPLLLGGP